jgi:hypothetical protein
METTDTLRDGLASAAAEILRGRTDETRLYVVVGGAEDHRASLAASLAANAAGTIVEEIPDETIGRALSWLVTRLRGSRPIVWCGPVDAATRALLAWAASCAGVESHVAVVMPPKTRKGHRPALRPARAEGAVPVPALMTKEGFTRVTCLFR